MGWDRGGTKVGIYCLCGRGERDEKCAVEKVSIRRTNVALRLERLRQAEYSVGTRMLVESLALTWSCPYLLPGRSWHSACRMQRNMSRL